VGLKLYRKWKTSMMFGIAAGGLLDGLELFIAQALLVKWLGRQPDLETFRALHGNVKRRLLAIEGTGHSRIGTLQSAPVPTLTPGTTSLG
jgi:hypothetical protein